MWRTEFPVSARRRAVLCGYKRSFCIWTVHARGTPEKPGLGLGLLDDDEGTCQGIALCIKADDRNMALELVWDREMWTDIYRPVWREVQTDYGPLTALLFEVDRSSRQFSEDLSMLETARYIASASGKFGHCRDYLFETAAALRQIDECGGEFDRLCALVREQAI